MYNFEDRYTTIEQSLELIKLGLDPETAYLCCVKVPKQIKKVVPNYDRMLVIRYHRGYKDGEIPCWNVKVLLEQLTENLNSEQVLKLIHIILKEK